MKTIEAFEKARNATKIDANTNEIVSIHIIPKDWVGQGRGEAVLIKNDHLFLRHFVKRQNISRKTGKVIKEEFIEKVTNWRISLKTILDSEWVEVEKNQITDEARIKFENDKLPVERKVVQ